MALYSELGNQPQKLTETRTQDASRSEVFLCQEMILVTQPFTPTSQNDVNCTGHNAIINPLIRNRAVTPWVDYRPTGFSPNYYSAGMAFKGVDTASLPDWATGFSIVETPPAGRVVAQGLGYYSLSSAGGSLQGNATKELREFAIYFPDLDDATGIDPSVIDAIKADPSAFEIQLVSPMGFFTEVFSFNNFKQRKPS